MLKNVRHVLGMSTLIYVEYVIYVIYLLQEVSMKARYGIVNCMSIYKYTSLNPTNKSGHTEFCQSFVCLFDCYGIIRFKE